ncbi:MAG: hypothetical protein MR384_12240, partial [Lachnospiraceae bacterium]|nr:hypothetical protein [Lachnospiraceae bacterium]
YTKEIYNQNKSGLGNFKNVTAIPNGIDGGWNTTENETYKGSLFEVWETAKDKIPVPAEWNDRDLTKNGKNFIEMNANSPAALYQDLATHGGDIIKWTLQHAARVGMGYQEQRMYVTVGSPEKDNRGKIIAAEGVNDRINTHIGDAGKARYNYNEILQSNNNFAFAKKEDLKGLSVSQKVNNKENKEWYDVAGIYVVPAGQEVTRFAFCADGTSKQDGEDIKGLSGGNFLDNITFSTLLGNLNATRQQDGKDNGDVKVTGYWGDKDSSKKLVIEIGDKKEEINMSSVIDENFEITIPKSVIGDATSLNIYHEDYKDATKTINITHKHEWAYIADNVGSGNHAKKVYAYCTNQASPQCSYVENNKNVYLTLTAYDAEYTGRAYDSARVTEWSIVDHTLAARPDIKYYREDSEAQYVLTTTANSGAASEGAAPKNVGKYYAEITVGNASARAEFEITPKKFTKEMVKCQKSFEYNGGEQKPSVIIMDGDKIYTEGEDYTILWPESPKDIGTYNFTITGKENCDGVFTIPWNITKASPKITAPSPGDITYGQTLNESTLSGGKATNGTGYKVEGAFSWNEGSKKPSVSDSKKTAYTLNFIPTDKVHYNQTSCKVKITVLPKEAELTWNPSSFIYNGENQQPSAFVSNLEDEDKGKVTVNVTVDGDHKDVNKEGYTAKASLDGDRKDNYKLTEEASKNVFHISPKKIISNMVSVNEKSYIHDGNMIFTPEITVKDGETKLEKDKDYTLSGAASGSAVGIYEIKVTGIGNYKGEVEDSFEIKDKTPPTGSIEIDNNKWESFLNDITFGLFFKETQSVKISASDEAGGSGVDKVYYYLTSEKKDKEALSKLPYEKWTGIENGGTFKIDPDNKYIIYTKIIDKSGNVSIISSDGIVVDKTPPVIEEIENNKTYCTDVLFTVTDGIELKSVTIDGEEKGISGKYSIAGTSEKKVHVIEAKDTAGNITKYTITLNAKGSHSFDGWKEVKKA